MNPKAIDRNSKNTPLIQVSSRGRRYAFMKSTLNRCTKAVATIKLADHEWIDRTSQPNGTRVMMNCTLSYASSALGR